MYILLIKFGYALPWGHLFPDQALNTWHFADGGGKKSQMEGGRERDRDSSEQYGIKYTLLYQKFWYLFKIFCT